MILLAAIRFAQNAAEMGLRFPLRYAMANGFGSLGLKSETWTQDTIIFQRDPSLLGRLGHSPVRPPRLFKTSEISATRQGFAEESSCKPRSWTDRSFSWSMAVSAIRIIEESKTCKDTDGLQQRESRLARWPHVVTQQASKRLPVQGQAAWPRLSLIKTRLSVPPSVLRATSLIARNIRTAADHFQHTVRVGFDRSRPWGSLGYEGGLFVCSGALCAARPET